MEKAFFSEKNRDQKTILMNIVTIKQLDRPHHPAALYPIAVGHEISMACRQ